jgi:AAA15 family ATPase/GTPase
MDFLVQLMKGGIDDWFQRRHWKPSDIYNHIDKKKIIEFTVELIDNAGQNLTWRSKYSAQNGCRSEWITIGNLVFYTFGKKNENARYYGLRNSPTNVVHEAKINFKYQGSIFSVLEDVEIPSKFYEFRDFILSIESFELISPHFLRQRTRESEGSIGLEGKGLASFLHEIGDIKRAKIVEQLAHVYPPIQSLIIKKLRAGWKQLDIQEKFTNTILKSESLHVSDGMLRLIAILAQLLSDRQVVVFDEIENGINTELVDFLLKEFLNAKQQIVVTTHSPLFMNYLEDELAKESVKYFYKTPEGYTRCIPFFEIPSIQEKLEVMGPGEAFADTDLIRLAHEITRCTSKREE